MQGFPQKFWIGFVGEGILALVKVAQTPVLL